MAINIAINGFGRIGRLVFRIASNDSRINIVAINDIVPCELLAYLIKYDSIHGRFNKSVKVEGNSLVVDGQKTMVLSERDPAQLPWGDFNVDYVVESTGRFTQHELAEKHLHAGARRVLISAPAKGDIPTFVMGVNHKTYNPETDRIISNASCTTNCLAPIAKVLLDNFGIEEGIMTTIHALTSSQPTVDGPTAKDFRGGRAGWQNVLPSSTGAAKAVALCLPEVKGKLTGMAFRVPIADVSVVDLTVRLSQSTTYADICHVMKEASEGEMKNILAYCNDPVVSSDFIGSTYSSIFDELAGIALNDRFYKIISWYDNEMGYSNRIVDMLSYMAEQESSFAGSEETR